jgi:hypothetical protein
VCREHIIEFRELHFIDEMSYAMIAHEFNYHPDTIRAYCTGKWKDYIPTSAK